MAAIVLVPMGELSPAPCTLTACENNTIYAQSDMRNQCTPFYDSVYASTWFNGLTRVLLQETKVIGRQGAKSS